MAGIIALICLVLIFVHWDTPLAAAYAVAFAGWIPHCFSTISKALFSNPGDANGHS
jgi:hypothetical protein